MAEKLTLARIKKGGHNFEISVDSDNALKYRQGELPDLHEVVLADQIFADAKRGQIASENELKEAFQTSEFEKVADIILKKGDIQLSAEHRSAQREEQRKKLIYMVHRNACDPQTKLPHPLTRIELALEQGKIHLDHNKSVEDQFDDIISKLRPIIPISIEKSKLLVTIPGQFTGKAYGFVKQNATIVKEDWKNDGAWEARVQLAAGMVEDFMNQLNGMTQGMAKIEHS